MRPRLSGLWWLSPRLWRVPRMLGRLRLRLLFVMGRLPHLLDLIAFRFRREIPITMAGLGPANCVLSVTLPTRCPGQAGVWW